MLKQEIKSQQMLEIKNQKVKEVWNPNEEILDQLGQDLSWKINRWENLIVFLIAFSLSMNEIYVLT